MNRGKLASSNKANSRRHVTYDISSTIVRTETVQPTTTTANNSNSTYRRLRKQPQDAKSASIGT